MNGELETCRYEKNLKNEVETESENGVSALSGITGAQTAGPAGDEGEGEGVGLAATPLSEGVASIAITRLKVEAPAERGRTLT